MDNEPKSFVAIGPGRLCLFGEHQDYLHLPVIALAIPLECRIEVSPTTNRVLEMDFPAMNQHFVYDLDNLPQRQPMDTENMDFALAGIHEALKDGWHFKYGATMVSSTTIPLQAGCSSSTAFCIAWIQILAKLAGKSLSPIEVAQRAWQAEVGHFGAPGGTMDHVSIALGNTCLRIGPGMWEVEALASLDPENHGVWVLADSGEPKDTMKHLKRCKQDRLALFDKLGKTWDSSENVDDLTKNERTLLDATLVNRRTEMEVHKAWSSSAGLPPDFGMVAAKLMDMHHAALRDGLLLSTPRLEAMREAAIGSGAWGFKVVGSGGGGCGVAWSPKLASELVAQAMKKAGARHTWILETASQGSRIEVPVGG